MMITRRHLMMTGAALALAGCTNNPNVPVATWAGALEAIGTELQALLPTIQAATNIPAATVANITSIINEIEAALSAISTASTQAQGQTVLVQVETYLNALATAITPFLSAIPTVGPVLGLIVAALPAIEAAVNLLISLISPQLAQLGQLAPTLPVSAELRRTGAPRSQVYMLLLIDQAKRHRHRKK